MSDSAGIVVIFAGSKGQAVDWLQDQKDLKGWDVIVPTATGAELTGLRREEVDRVEFVGTWHRVEWTEPVWRDWIRTEGLG